jgi:hypothetical protein
MNIELKDLDYIVREYLVHSGYQESFVALDIDTTRENKTNDIIDGRDNENILRKESIDMFYQSNHFPAARAQSMEITDENPIEYDKLRKYSADEGMMKEPDVRKRTLSIMMDRMKGILLHNKIFIIYIDEKSSDDIFEIMNFLEERKIIQNMLIEKDYDTALNYFENQFKQYSAKKQINFKKIILCLTTAKYLESLKVNDFQTAYQILNKLDSSYWSKDITVSMYDNEDKITDYNLEVSIHFKII